jgi:16S rRNA (guanine(966)-N(2))-methyltransferase RsmD
MKLFSPKTTASRPITDRVKESLFNVLRKYDLPADKVIADLFSGVGSLGLESLSRGAKFVIFVEKDPQVAAILKRNVEKAGFVNCSKILKADAFKIGAPVDKQKYDLVFVDPPYAMTTQTGAGSPLYKLLDMLSYQVTQDGFVVVSTQENIQLLQQYNRFTAIERRQWGTMAVTILK